ncbi:MAG: hypothetical protein P8074_26395 [Anaerolineales bacterium]
MQYDPVQVTLKVTATLEKLGVPYLIGGPLASTLYGMVRTTQDSDIVAELEHRHIQSFVEALQEGFYIDEEMIFDAVAHHSSFNIIHRESMFKVDIFIPRQRHFEKMQFSRARREALSKEPEATAFVATAEDTLLAKLERYRMGSEASERQWRDVLGVIAVQASALDLDYLHRMAKEIEVEDLLKRAFSEA